MLDAIFPFSSLLPLLLLFSFVYWIRQNARAAREEERMSKQKNDSSFSRDKKEEGIKKQKNPFENVSISYSLETDERKNSVFLSTWKLYF